MDKWIAIKNGSTKEFDSFDVAVEYFRKQIRVYFRENDDIFSETSCTPFQISAFFSAKYDDGTVTDEEIVVSERMEMLLNSFMWPKAKDQKQDALRAIKNDIAYNGKIELDYYETVSIQITKTDDEMSFSGIFNEDEEDETFLKTNAFIFDDDSKRYYFKSHQEVVTSQTLDKLGEVADLDLVLKRQ